MAQDIDGLLAPFADGSYPLRVLDAIFKVSPDAPRVRPYTSLQQAAPSLGMSEDAQLIEAARGIARDQPAQSAVWMLQALDVGDDVMSVLGGVAAALKLYVADKAGSGQAASAETSKARQQQREDAVKKGLGIAWAVGRLFGGTPEERVRAFLECEGGRALLSFYATVEIAVPFPADTSKDGRALVSALYEELQELEMGELSKAVGEDSAKLALQILPLLMPHLLESVDANARRIEMLVENMRKRVPTLLDYTGALGGAVGHGVDALPMYHLLGARLVAEASLRQAADPERFPPASDDDKEAALEEAREQARQEAEAAAQAQVEAVQAEAQAEVERARAQAQAELEAARAEAEAIRAQAQEALRRAQAAEEQAQAEAKARRAAEEDAAQAAAAAAAAALAASQAAEQARERAQADAAEEMQKLQAEAEAREAAAQAEAARLKAQAEAAEQARRQAEQAADRAAIERQVAHQKTFPPPPEPEPEPEPEPRVSPPPPDPIASPEPPPPPKKESPPPPKQEPPPPEPEEKKGGKGKWVVLGGLFLLLVGCCGLAGAGGLWAWMEQDKPPKKTQPVYVTPDGKRVDPSQVPGKKK